MATFGYTTVGANTWLTAAGTQYRVTKFTPTENGSITSISAYIYMSSGTGNMGVSIYGDSGGTPSAFLAQEIATVSIDTTQQWNTVNINYPVVANVTYWLGVWVSTNQASFKWDNGSTNQTNYSNGTFEKWPQPYAGGSYQDRVFSVYATYTPVVTEHNPHYYRKQGFQ